MHWFTLQVIILLFDLIKSVTASNCIFLNKTEVFFLLESELHILTYYMSQSAWCKYDTKQKHACFPHPEYNIISYFRLYTVKFVSLLSHLTQTWSFLFGDSWLNHWKDTESENNVSIRRSLKNVWTLFAFE